MLHYKDIKKSLLVFYSQLGKADSNRISKLSCYVYSLIHQGQSHLESLAKQVNKNTDLQSRVKEVKRFLQSKYTDCELLFRFGGPIPFYQGIDSRNS